MYQVFVPTELILRPTVALSTINTLPLILPSTTTITTILPSCKYYLVSLITIYISF